ncbi:MAG: exo-alpha-sialidase [Chitinophagaceae bacterium]|nr:MAG: exo-alpha-sialidase [Chitinophagaceae bacterium]
MKANQSRYQSSRRSFLQNASLLAAGLPLAGLSKFSWSNEKDIMDTSVIQIKPETILSDPRVQLNFGKDHMILPDGLQSSMLCTKSGALIVQGQLSKKPYPQKRIFYPFALSTVVSRDKGRNWKAFLLKPGDNGVNMEGGAIQLKDGTILVLDTYVTPGESPDLGIGLLYTSNDDYRTLQGPETITFTIPEAEFYGSTDDGGRPHAAMRLHRRMIEMPNGDLLATMYGWLKGDNTPSDYEHSMRKTRVMLFQSTNKGKHWNMISTVAVGSDIGTEGFGEPVITRISQGPHAGRILCLMRTGRELYETFSDDGGFTWAPPRPRVFANIDVYRTDLWAKMFKDVKRYGLPVEDNPVENIGAVVDPDLLELPNGVLVAAFGVRIPAKACFINPSFPWNGDYLAFSLDHGITWSHVVRLTSGIATTQYMAIEKMPEDNRIFVACDYGYWNYKGGRYLYGFPLDISVHKK